jgi:TPP-dependent pyruvate/acetoin dehydrogenase alpha subunit
MRGGSDDINSMSDPGTTYRTREEVKRMRSTQDPIRGLQRYLEEWGVATDAELKASSPNTFSRILTNKRAYIGNR